MQAPEAQVGSLMLKGKGTELWVEGFSRRWANKVTT